MLCPGTTRHALALEHPEPALAFIEDGQPAAALDQVMGGADADHPCPDHQDIRSAFYFRTVLDLPRRHAGHRK